MKRRSVLTNVATLAISALVGLILCEVGARVALNPADYLSVEMVNDPVLGGVPTGAGFDAWGFRNPQVPNNVDIVAIGDSHTYGNTARMEDSWPYVLAAISGRSVYNMGLGGYGPNQYFHLFKTKALALRPKTILVGLYIGDDFENAFLITYGLEHWAYLRSMEGRNANFDIWEEPQAPTWHKRLRIWLSRHSVVYQLIFHGPLLGRFQGEMQIQHASTLQPDYVTTLTIPEKNIQEAFRPKNMLRVLDQDSDSIRDGMRITFELLSEMNAACQQNNVEFLVVIIPTKEMVFAEYLEHRPGLPLNDVIDKLLANERVARERTLKFLSAAGIPFVDTLPSLRQSIGDELYARTAADMHPNANGYRVIGKAVADALPRPR